MMLDLLPCCQVVFSEAPAYVVLEEKRGLGQGKETIAGWEIIFFHC